MARELHSYDELDKRDDLGRTLLMCMCEHGSDSMVKGLLHHKADAGLRDNSGVDALSRAVKRPEATEIVGQLLQCHAKPNAADDTGTTPLMHACEAGAVHAAELLLRARACPTSTNNAGQSALTIAARHSPRMHELLAKWNPKSELLDAPPAASAPPDPAAELPCSPPSSPPTNSIDVLLQKATSVKAESAARHGRSSATATPALLQRRVELRGLSGRPELNGRRGVAVSFDPKTGRYGVQLDGKVREKVALRPDNIQAETPEVADEYADGSSSAAPSGVNGVRPLKIDVTAAEEPGSSVKAVADGHAIGSAPAEACAPSPGSPQAPTKHPFSLGGFLTSELPSLTQIGLSARDSPGNDTQSLADFGSVVDAVHNNPDASIEELVRLVKGPCQQVDEKSSAGNSPDGDSPDGRWPAAEAKATGEASPEGSGGSARNSAGTSSGSPSENDPTPLSPVLEQQPKSPLGAKPANGPRAGATDGKGQRGTRTSGREAQRGGVNKSGPLSEITTSMSPTLESPRTPALSAGLEALERSLPSSRNGSRPGSRSPSPAPQPETPGANPMRVGGGADADGKGFRLPATGVSLELINDTKDVEAVRAWLALGADVDAPLDPTGGTLLMNAAFMGHLEMLELLLEHGANVRRRPEPRP